MKASVRNLTAAERAECEGLAAMVSELSTLPTYEDLSLRQRMLDDLAAKRASLTIEIEKLEAKVLGQQI